MSSTRFPGKVLHRVAGKPMLQYLFERLNRCNGFDAMVVATSQECEDDSVEDFCRDMGITCFRGVLANVAHRFIQVVDAYRFDAFVRISGDSPLLDPGLVDYAVRFFRESESDLVTNILHRTFPSGQSVEVICSSAFRRAYGMMRDPEDFEHVTKVFYKHPDGFRINDFQSLVSYNGVHLSVDTPDEMNRFAAIVCQMQKPHWQYSLIEIVELYRQIQMN